MNTKTKHKVRLRVRLAQKIAAAFAVVALPAAGLAMTASPASAENGTTYSNATQAQSVSTTTTDDPQSCADVDMTTDSGYCIEEYNSSAAAETTDKSVAAVGTKGKILTRYAVAAGIKLKKRERNNNRCKLVQKASQIPAGATCIRGARGFKYKNSGYNKDDVFTVWMDYVGSPTSSTPNADWMKFVKRHGQWLKAGDQTGAGNCKNKVWFNGHGPKTTLTWKQVINIKSFANWVFKGNVAVKASALAKVKVKAWCQTAHTSASAEGSGSGDAASAASAAYKVRGLSKIMQWTNAKEAELTSNLNLTVNAGAKAKAVANAKADAYAKVSCEEVPVTPSTASPQLLTIDTVNDVLVNNTRTITPQGTVADGRTAMLFCHAGPGAITSGASQTVSGSFSAPITYKAPSEATTDQVSCTLTQDDGQTDEISTNVFNIVQPNPDPM